MTDRSARCSHGSIWWVLLAFAAIGAVSLCVLIAKGSRGIGAQQVKLSGTADPSPAAEPTSTISANSKEFTASASVSPSVAGDGGSVTIVAAIRSSLAVHSRVEIDVDGPDGSSVFHQAFDDQTFVPGVSQALTTMWTVGASEPGGPHSVRVAIFAPGETTPLNSTDRAATVTIDPSLGQPTTVSTPSKPIEIPSAQPAIPLPFGWPATLQVGVSSGLGDTTLGGNSAPFGFRYQYLAGGANTGKGWTTWRTPAGSFVPAYVQESTENHLIPVFTYYQLRQSNSNGSLSDADADAAGLKNPGTMAAYFGDLKLFFQEAGGYPSTTIVLHVEPDLWGFLQQRSQGDNAATVPAQVAATGMPELAGLPNTAAGLAQAIVLLRNRYAPNVLIAYHLSVWGTGTDILRAKPDDFTTRALANRSVAFYASLKAPFDLTFTEFLDRDSGFYQSESGDSGAWYKPDDYDRLALFLSVFSTRANQHLVLWQIPYGNTIMRAENNTSGHFQSNQVETLLGDSSRSYLERYRKSGVIALLFGSGGAGATCACDGNKDGVTNPPAINGNSRASLTADDDGGYFREQVAKYYATGALALFTATSTP